MLGEWIKLLGLDGVDPPWEGKPREIRGQISINGELVRIRVIDLIDCGKDVKALIEICKKADEEVSLTENDSGGWVDTRELHQITILY